MSENRNGAPPLTGLAAWRPIETAPRDGSRIVVRQPNWGRFAVVAWKDGPFDTGWWPQEKHPCWLIHDNEMGRKDWFWSGQVLPGSDEPSAAAHGTARGPLSTPSTTNADLGELVARLRAYPLRDGWHQVTTEAADAIEAQQREIEGLRNAVEQWKANTGQLAAERDALRTKLDRAAEALGYLGCAVDDTAAAHPFNVSQWEMLYRARNHAKDVHAELTQEGGNDR